MGEDRVLGSPGGFSVWGIVWLLFLIVTPVGLCDAQKVISWMHCWCSMWCYIIQFQLLHTKFAPLSPKPPPL